METYNDKSDSSFARNRRNVVGKQAFASTKFSVSTIGARGAWAATEDAVVAVINQLQINIDREVTTKVQAS